MPVDCCLCASFFPLSVMELIKDEILVFDNCNSLQKAIGFFVVKLLICTSGANIEGGR